VIDLVLHSGSFIVGLIDAAGECDEAGAEIPLCFEFADLVLGLPKRDVEQLELSYMRFHARCIETRLRTDCAQAREFGRDVAQFGRIADPLGLDLQDSDLVDQFTDRDWRKDRLAAIWHSPPRCL
jgi:hypothetical protein